MNHAFAWHVVTATKSKRTCDLIDDELAKGFAHICADLARTSHLTCLLRFRFSIHVHGWLVTFLYPSSKGSTLAISTRSWMKTSCGGAREFWLHHRCLFSWHLAIASLCETMWCLVVDVSGISKNAHPTKKTQWLAKCAKLRPA